MADNKEQKGKSDRNKVSGSENYEIQYFKDTLGVSSQAVAGAIRATKSNDRKVLTEYLKKSTSQTYGKSTTTPSLWQPGL